MSTECVMRLRVYNTSQTNSVNLNAKDQCVAKNGESPIEMQPYIHI